MKVPIVAKTAVGGNGEWELPNVEQGRANKIALRLISQGN
jgi:hypothetical protein